MAALNTVKPILLFGYGNPSRGDDALGPLLIEHMEQLNLPNVECLTDMQLQVEHVMDLEGRDRILFIDADVSSEQALAFSLLAPEKDGSYTSHAMSPEALLHAYAKVIGFEAPPTYMLSIRGFDFALGDSLTEQALKNLAFASIMTKNLCADSSEQNWHQYLSLPEQVYSINQKPDPCGYTLPTSIEKTNQV